MIGDDTSFGNVEAATANKLFVTVAPERKFAATGAFVDTKEKAFHDLATFGSADKGRSKKDFREGNFRTDKIVAESDEGRMCAADGAPAQDSEPQRK